MVPTRKRIFLAFFLIVILILLLRIVYYYNSIQTDVPAFQKVAGAPVLVMVFYEALCPDSKFFITKQLLSTYKAAAPIMEVQLVPYGKAHTKIDSEGNYIFECQHGVTECQANTYHACAIEAIEDPLTRLEVITCMIRDNRHPKEAMHKCTRQHSVEHDIIQKCFDSNHGAELMKINGDATHALRPAVQFIPTITLDGSQGRQASILKDLLGEVCKAAGDTNESAKFCKKV